MDPGHPLCGLTLPLRSVWMHPRHGRVCAVVVGPATERLVPVAATDLGGGVPPPARGRLSVPAAEALLAVVASLLASGREDGDASGDGSDGGGPAYARGRCGGAWARRRKRAAARPSCGCCWRRWARRPRRRRAAEKLVVADPVAAGTADKIAARRRERRVSVYVRKSTLQRVEHHRESQANQYALVQRALALGWPRERVHVVDADLGQSGQDGAAPASRRWWPRCRSARSASSSPTRPAAWPGTTPTGTACSTWRRWSAPSSATPTGSTTRATTTTACSWASGAC